MVAFTLKRSQEPNQPSSLPNHYGLSTPEENSYHATTTYVRINDILRSKDPKDLIDLPENVIKVGKIS